MFRPGKADLEWLQQRLDSVLLYLIQRFLERFDLPDRNQQILKLIGIRHFFYVLTGRGRQRRKMTFQSVPYSFLQLFNEFSFAFSYPLSSALSSALSYPYSSAFSSALSYPYSSALSHTLSPEFFLPRIKSFRIHSNSSFQSRIFRKIYADPRFRQDNIPEPIAKEGGAVSIYWGLTRPPLCGHRKQSCTDEGGGLYQPRKTQYTAQLGKDG